MTHTLVGVFDDYSRAQAALNELRAAGFAIETIRLSPEDETFEARRRATHDDVSEAPGGVRGLFHALFGSPAQERHSGLYSEAIRRGSYMLSVHADTEDQVEVANRILARYDPVDIDERASSWQQRGWSGYAHGTPAFSDEEVRQERALHAASAAEPTSAVAAPPPAGLASGDQRAIPVIEEELQVGKREVQRGGVRVFQHVSERPVQETVHLRDEHVSIERHPVNQPATQADLDALKEGTFEMRERAEEAVVAKTARVVEEVVLGKTVTEHDETISDTLRKTEVEVERIPGAEGDVESLYRSHWSSNYGSVAGARYEDYAPAYQFGARLAADPRYRQYRYADVEPELERDWRVAHAAHPWERFKDAVRYGWERVTR